MRIEACASCYFWVFQQDKTTPYAQGYCYRFPQHVIHGQYSWCGEWRVDAEKACAAEGPEYSPALSGFPPLKMHDGTIYPGIAGRPAIHRQCLLPKGHDGRHRDGTHEWSMDPRSSAYVGHEEARRLGVKCSCKDGNIDPYCPHHGR